MKKLTLIPILMLALFYGQAQESTSSEIKSVKVFTQGAEIVRTVKLNLKTGKNELKLTKLSSDLDPKTIQVSGENFTILSVRHSPDFVENENTPAKISILVTEKELIMDSITRVDMQLDILSQQHAMLMSNMELIGDDGIKNEDFKESISYFNQQFREIANAQYSLNKTNLNLAKRASNLNRQILVAAGKEKDPPSNIFLTLDSKTNQEVNLQVSYSITEAGWFPAYDIRAINTNSPIKLTYKARVYQNSGVDWKNVKLSISSGDLVSSGTAPQLSPYYIGDADYENYNNTSYFDPSITGVAGKVVDETGQGLPSVTILIKGSTQGVQTNADGYYDLQLPTGKNTLVYRFLGYTQQEVVIGNQNRINIQMQPEVSELDEVVVTALGITRDKASLGYAVTNLSAGELIPGGTSRGFTSVAPSRFLSKKEAKPRRTTTNILASQINYQTTFVYDIDVPYDVPSTGEPQLVQMLEKELETEYVYYAAPKIKEQAFLVAKISDWTELNLIDGESNLYFENSFVGKSIIDTNIGMDTLELSLGKDESIIVKRERQKDFEENKFLSGKKREERHWLITVVNAKSDSVNVNLKDQIPVTVKSSFKVNVIELSNAKLEKESGLLTWNLKLAPGEKRELRVRYYVDQPRDSDFIVN